MRRKTNEKALCAVFTLLELLIVIAVIAILASIFLPALSKARESSKGTVCASNLKQLGQLAFIYSDDYDGWMPLSKQTNGTPVRMWENSLADEMENPGSWSCWAANPDGTGWLNTPPRIRKLFLCPAAGTDYAGTKCKFGISYGYNQRIGDILDFATNINYSPRKLIRQTNKLAITADLDITNAARVFIDNAYMDFRHAGKANVLFCDGHINSCARVTVSTWNTWKTDGTSETMPR